VGGGGRGTYLEVAVSLLRAVEGDELLRLDCEDRAKTGCERGAGRADNSLNGGAYRLT